MLAASTHDQEVFSFNPDERFCQGFEEVLTRYRELVPQLKLAGIVSVVKLHVHFYCILFSFSLILFLALTHGRTNIIWSNHRDGNHHSWAKWRPIPCLGDHSRWPGRALSELDFFFILMVLLLWKVWGCWWWNSYLKYCTLTLKLK